MQCRVNVVAHGFAFFLGLIIALVRGGKRQSELSCQLISPKLAGILAFCSLGAEILPTFTLFRCPSTGANPASPSPLSSDL